MSLYKPHQLLKSTGVNPLRVSLFHEDIKILFMFFPQQVKYLKNGKKLLHLFEPYEEKALLPYNKVSNTKHEN